VGGGGPSATPTVPRGAGIRRPRVSFRGHAPGTDAPPSGVAIARRSPPPKALLSHRLSIHTGGIGAPQGHYRTSTECEGLRSGADLLAAPDLLRHGTAPVGRYSPMRRKVRRGPVPHRRARRVRTAGGGETIDRRRRLPPRRRLQSPRRFPLVEPASAHPGSFSPILHFQISKDVPQCRFVKSSDPVASSP
jgi:hypothetical protein